MLFYVYLRIVDLTKKIALIFANDFPEGEKNNARLKSIGEVFVRNNWRCDYVSIYPTSYNSKKVRKQEKQWNGSRVIHIANWSSYPSYLLVRMLQIIVCHFSFLFFILFQSSKYDILYFYTPKWIGTLPGMLLACLCKKTTIVDQTDLHSTFKNAFIHRSEEYFVSRIPNALCVISPYLYDHFLSKNSKILHLVPIMVNMKRFKMNINPERHFLCYLGTFSEKDGVVDILKGFKKALMDLPELKIRLIGRDPFDKSTKELIAKLNIGSSVELTGAVDFNNIPKLLMECDTFIMNRNLSEFSETGYPIKLGEYFACNRPVLMSEGNGYQLFFTDKEEVIKYKSNCLADAIVYRYKNKTFSEIISNNGHKYALENFNSTIVAQKIVDIANNLCEKK